MTNPLPGWESFIELEIKRFVKESGANRLSMLDSSPIFDEPLIGFASGGDPIFADYKRIIGPFHWHPRNLLQQYAMDRNYEGSLDDISVVCWILPIAADTVESNAGQEKAPSLRWAHTRDTGEKFNVLLRRHLVGLLEEKGFLAIAPMDSKYWEIVMDERHGFASAWSERHALYAAGLGTFSLTDALITPKGAAHRCGSVIVNMNLKPTPRIYKNHRANCLFYNSGTCGDCIRRCPAGAISPSGHDKSKCSTYVYLHCIEELREEYNIDVTTGCGLCQAGVPCSTQIPEKPKAPRDG